MAVTIPDAAAVRQRVVDGLFPPVREIVVAIDRVEAEARAVREKHGTAALPHSFWSRLSSLVRARDTYLEAVER